MSYPGRGYSLPDALMALIPLRKLEDEVIYTDPLNPKQQVELVEFLIDSGWSMRHICGSWVVRPAGNVPLYQFLMEELVDEIWWTLRDWIAGWMEEGFDIVEETAVIQFSIQGC